MLKSVWSNHQSCTGKRVVELQLSKSLVSAPKSPVQLQTEGPDEFGRIPFTHPALDGLLNLSELTKSEILDKSRLCEIARSHSLEGVIRWKPRKVLYILPHLWLLALNYNVNQIPGRKSSRIGTGSSRCSSNLCHYRCHCTGKRW
jgi:hypothetical protein